MSQSRCRVFARRAEVACPCCRAWVEGGEGGEDGVLLCFCRDVYVPEVYVQVPSTIVPCEAGTITVEGLTSNLKQVSQ
jgi:hypothetical protein